MTENIAFHDISPESFPFVIQALDDDTLEKLWQEEVKGPGALKVPGFAPRKVRIRIWYPDGTVVEQLPNGNSYVYDLSEELKQIREGMG